MAEGGLLGELLVGDSESEEALERAAQTDGQGLAAGLALELARTEPLVAHRAADFLERQSRLLDIQAEHARAEHPLRLSHLRSQSREGRIRRVGQRLRISMQVFLALVASLIGIGAVLMVWEAAHDRRLVVEPFSVPPDLAARGASGRVLAAQFLDRLGAINAKASSMRAPTSYAGNWGEDVKLEIPETGVSIGDLRRFLQSWLGHETHVTGEVVRMPAGLSLTVRAGEEPGRTVTGPDDKLPDLLQQAAENTFEATQPYRYAAYLQNQGKLAESLAADRRLAESDAPSRERAWALVGISGLLGTLGDPGGAVRAAQESERLDPTIAGAYFNGATGWYMLGRDEQLLADSRAGLRQLDRNAADLSKSVVGGLRFGNEASIADSLGDYAAAAELDRAQADEPDYEGFRTTALIARSYELARAHDLAGSLRAAALQPASDIAGALQLNTWGEAFVPGYERKAALGDWAGAADDMRGTIAGVPPTAGNPRYLVPRFLQPRLAYALARGGRQAEAEAIASTLPTDCYRCLWTRGWVATTARDWTRADREFAAAVRLAPSIPLAYAAWGESLAIRGDLDAAATRLKQATERGPRFADPLKIWGDVLSRKGQWREALRKYDKALKSAPAWTELHRARDVAAHKV